MCNNIKHTYRYIYIRLVGSCRMTGTEKELDGSREKPPHNLPKAYTGRMDKPTKIFKDTGEGPLEPNYTVQHGEATCEATQEKSTES